MQQAPVQPTGVGQAALSILERRAILDREIEPYVRKGFHVTSRTDTTAQLLKAKKFSCLFATLWFLLFGIGLVIYLIYYAAGRDELIYLEVDPLGNVSRTKRN
jgi:hypothetical protein